MTAAPLRIGRNLQSLEFTSDIAPRATRLAAICARLGGVPTFLGNSRWKVTSNASGTLTLADPAGGAPPVKFDDQFNAVSSWWVYREATAQLYAITGSAASPSTVTISGDPGIAVDEYVQFRSASTSGSPIAVGPGGQVGSAARGYILPLIVTGIASNVLTIENDALVAGVGSDDQYVGDAAAFSAYVQTSVVDISCVNNAFPVFTVTITSGSDTSGLLVGDWLYNVTASQYLGAFPPLEITTIVDASTLLCVPRSSGPSFATGMSGETVHFVRPGTSSTVTASTLSPNTVTVASAAGWSVAGGNGALELSYTPSTGQIPPWLDHPVYGADRVLDTDPGIGLKFGAIERPEYTAVANLSANAVLRNWTGGMPDGYAALPVGGSGTVTQITDPLYTPLSGYSAKVSGVQVFRTPVISWRPAYPNQRFSFRVKLFIAGKWSGDSTADMLIMRPGYVTADGKAYLFSWNDPIYIAVPPDSSSTITTWQKPAAGQWFDAVLNGFDITTSKGLGSLGQGGTFDSSAATVANAVGFFVAICGNGTAPPDYYFGGASITATDVAPDAITEFHDANKAHQDVNVALSLIAKPQTEITAEVIDLQRMNPDSADTIDTLDYPGSVLIHSTDLGIVNETERIVEIIRDWKRPGRTQITIANRFKRFIELFYKHTQSAIQGVQNTVNAIQSGGSNVAPAPSPPPSSSGSVTPPTIALTVTVADDGTTTIAAVTSSDTASVKIAYSTSGKPTLTDVRAASPITTLPVTIAGTTLTSGQTLYAAGLAYTAQEVESALANADATYTVSGCALSATTLANTAYAQGDDYAGGNPPLPAYANLAAFDAYYLGTSFREAYDHADDAINDGVSHSLDTSVTFHGHQTLKMAFGKPAATTYRGAGWNTKYTDDGDPTETYYTAAPHGPRNQWFRARWKADAGVMSDPTATSAFTGLLIVDMSGKNSELALYNRGGNIVLDYNRRATADGGAISTTSVTVCAEGTFVGATDFGELIGLYESDTPGRQIRIRVWAGPACSLAGATALVDTGWIPAHIGTSGLGLTDELALDNVEQHFDCQFIPSGALKYLWVADWETMPTTAAANPFGVSLV